MFLCSFHIFFVGHWWLGSCMVDGAHPLHWGWLHWCVCVCVVMVVLWCNVLLTHTHVGFHFQLVLVVAVVVVVVAGRAGRRVSAGSRRARAG